MHQLANNLTPLGTCRVQGNTFWTWISWFSKGNHPLCDPYPDLWSIIELACRLAVSKFYDEASIWVAKQNTGFSFMNRSFLTILVYYLNVFSCVLPINEGLGSCLLSLGMKSISPSVIDLLLCQRGFLFRPRCLFFYLPQPPCEYINSKKSFR